MKLINTKNKCFFVTIILTTNDFIYLFLTTFSLIFQTQKLKLKRKQNIWIKIYNYQTKRIKKGINKKKALIYCF